MPNNRIKNTVLFKNCQNNQHLEQKKQKSCIRSEMSWKFFVCKKKSQKTILFITFPSANNLNEFVCFNRKAVWIIHCCRESSLPWKLKIYVTVTTKRERLCFKLWNQERKKSTERNEKKRTTYRQSNKKY